ncbi:MAG: AAA family ATPase [Burkholderiaceae bacterium]
MYESHFGFSGPPFQLVPDPGFFFGSRGHSNALAFLRSAAQQGDGFLVVTGEIGAGKTTLVRILLEGLDAHQVTAATLVSTQLESGDLPQAILLAFGAAHAAGTRAQLSASLEAYLSDLAAQGRRALLIVDEAQNLKRGLMEELRMLSNLQYGANALLQVFLVGQPDLRTLMQAKAMEQLRQRVTASCHLGPLDASETSAYVQHRLRRVGWIGNPPIEALAYAALHEWTAGIPRRINRLFNRVLLATFLERQKSITAEAVEQIARDLRSEIGESDETLPMQASYVLAEPPDTRCAAEVRPAAPSVAAQTPIVHPAAPSGDPSRVSHIADATSAPVRALDPAADSVHEPVARILTTASHAAGPAIAVEPQSGAAPPTVSTVPVPEEDEDAHDSAFTGGFTSAAAEPRVAPPATRSQANLPGRTPASAAAQVTRRMPHDAALGKAERKAPPGQGPAPAPGAPPIEATARPPEHRSADRRSTAAGEARAGVSPAMHPAVDEPLVLLVDCANEYVKARALGRVLSEEPTLPPALIVHTGSLLSLHVGEEIAGVMPQKTQDVHLDINEHGGAASAALAITRFDALLRGYRPKAILAMGASDTLLTCTLFAHKSGIPVLRNDAGRRRAWSRPGEQMNAVLLEHLADSAYIGDLATFYTLYRAGIPTERVLLVGNLADNVVHCAAQHMVHPREIMRRAGVVPEVLNGASGYALCTAQFESPRAAAEEGLELIAMLTQVAREIPVLWAANPVTLREIESLGKRTALKQARIEVAASLAYLDCIDLLRGARCLLSGSAGRFLDDAVALAVPSIVLGKGMVVPVKSTEAMQLSVALPVNKLSTALAEVLAQPAEPRDAASFWDGGAAARIALHLAEWLPNRAGKDTGATPSSIAPHFPERAPKHSDAQVEDVAAS